MTITAIPASATAVVAAKPESSLAKVLGALDQFGWTYEVAEDAAIQPNKRANWDAEARVPGFTVKFTNKGRPRGNGPYAAYSDEHGHVSFTDAGRIIVFTIGGNYPFYRDIPLSSLLEKIEEYGPVTLRAKRAEWDAEQAAKSDAEQIRVREVHEKAKADLTFQQARVAAVLAEEAGLTEAQARAVLVVLQRTDDNPCAALVNAQGAVERTGKGYIPNADGIGGNWASGTYVDGKRVG